MPELSSRFVRDGDVVEGTRVPLGAAFSKSWWVQNTGSNAWGTIYIKQLDGIPVSTSGRFPVQRANLLHPNENVEITIPVKALARAGRYVSWWRLEQQGKVFGDRLLLDFFVDPVGVKSQQQNPNHQEKSLAFGGAKDGETWSCDQCTFVNKCGVANCHVCGQSKPAAASTAPSFAAPVTGRRAARARAPAPALVPAPNLAPAPTPRLVQFQKATRLALGSHARYWIVASAKSQYGIGAVSACTNMSVQAAHTILNHLNNNPQFRSGPLGYTVKLIESILEDAGSYLSTAHQSTIEVLRAR
jgi:hypothetical protein